MKCPKCGYDIPEFDDEEDNEKTRLPSHLLENALVRLWRTKDGKIYKIEIRHKDFSAYLDPPTDMIPNA